MWARDLDGDARPDLLAQTAEGLSAWQNDPSAGWTETVAYEGSPDVVATFDADNDEDLDLFVAEGEAGRFILQGDEGWAQSEALKLNLPGKVHAATALDYDHDVDLDVLCVGDFGARGPSSTVAKAQACGATVGNADELLPYLTETV